MFKILSIDGGGIRGVIPAALLAALEQRLGKPVAECFDLVAGTSTGGILALALTRRGTGGKPAFSAAELVELYAERGREIFRRSPWHAVGSLGGLVEERYPADSLERVLREYLGDTVLRDAITKVMVTTYDIERREPVFLKSWREDRNGIEMWRAARATSAAPIYFEPAHVEVQGMLRALVDGGVFVNNPAMSAFAEARRLGAKEDDILVVSLGTGELTRPIPHAEAKSWGLATWAIPLLGIIFDGVSDAVNYQLDQLLAGRHLRFQTALEIASDDLDNVTRANILALRKEAEQILRIEGAKFERLLEQLA